MEIVIGLGVVVAIVVAICAYIAWKREQKRLHDEKWTAAYNAVIQDHPELTDAFDKFTRFMKKFIRELDQQSMTLTFER